ncbi:MAG: pyridoxamine 5'-phosphate oxidase [Proteobacteria bacterium]|nr:MAG: pyridoxamine 5'-phosphate oxidase [Pseudomonadota bacterium]QKK10849.1 MAG: pyridoxamine 5'-phosphate oxidase [Pseudomonadota bacterium]
MSDRSYQHAFSAAERQAQQRWGRPEVWDAARRERLLWDHIPAEYHARIEAAPFFFLATADRSGHCDCSFKGGGPGLVRVLDARRLAFPDFAGNQAFMSLGNILDNPQVGLLFIDFSDGARLRVNGRAMIHDRGEPLLWFDRAPRVIEIVIEQVVPNCAAHIPKLVPAEVGL